MALTEAMASPSVHAGHQAVHQAQQLLVTGSEACRCKSCQGSRVEKGFHGASPAASPCQPTPDLPGLTPRCVRLLVAACMWHVRAGGAHGTLWPAQGAVTVPCGRLLQSKGLRPWLLVKALLSVPACLRDSCSCCCSGTVDFTRTPSMFCFDIYLRCHTSSARCRGGF